MAITVHLGRHSHVHPRVRKVDASRPLTWLELGWRDFRTHSRVSTAHGLLLTAAGMILVILGSTHPYLIAAAITGFLLVGPLMTTGVCEVSRRAHAGEEPVSFDDSLEGFSRNGSALLEFGLILAGVAVLWFVLSEVLLRWMLASEAPSLGQVLYGELVGAASATEILAYVLVGGALAGLVFVLSAVSVPLIIHRHASAGDAMRTSVRAVFANLPAMLVWSAMLVVLTAIGFGTLLIGMIWIAPLLGHATWHAYRDLVEPE